MSTRRVMDRVDRYSLPAFEVLAEMEQEEPERFEVLIDLLRRVFGHQDRLANTAGKHILGDVPQEKRR